MQIDGVEGLRPDALSSLRRQDFDVAIRPPTMHGEGFLRRVDDPIVRDLALVVDTLLLDEIVASVRREDLADPSGQDGDGHAGGTLGHALAAPANNVGAEELPPREEDLDLGSEPPAARPASPGPTTKPAVEGRHDVRLRAPVLPRG